MRLSLIHQSPRSHPLPENCTIWRTCLREIAFVDDLPRDAVPGSGWLTDGDAYGLLVEIVTGLRSPLIGETEVQAQFKAFLASLDGARHAKLLKLGQRVLGDAKTIRQRHLQGFGAHSYGRLALAPHSRPRRRRARRDRRPGQGRSRRARRQAPRGAVGSRRATARPCSARRRPCEPSNDVAIVVAAPVSGPALAAVIACYPRLVAVIDLRSTDERTPLVLDARVVTLEDLFADARQSGTLAAGHVDRARADIHQLGREYDRRLELRPFGWDDVCA